MLIAGWTTCFGNTDTGAVLRGGREGGKVHRGGGVELRLEG